MNTSSSVKQMTRSETDAHLERVMFKLPKNKSRDEHKMYLAGVIDTLCEVGLITEKIRDGLYVRYVG